MICPSCHKENDDSKKFCTHCGAKLPSQTFCTKCGSPLTPNQKFCIKCGTPNPNYIVAAQQAPNNPQGNSGAPSNQQNVGAQSAPSYPVFTAPAQPTGQPQQAPVHSAAAEQPIAQPQQPQVKPVATVKTPPAEPKPAQVSEETESDELPVYEENEKIGKTSPWIIIVIAAILLGGGLLAAGQYFNWWNISALSWIGKSGGSNTETVATDSAYMVVETEPEAYEVDTNAVVEEMIIESAAEEAESKIPYSVTLTGAIGGKYAVEMILDGQKDSAGFYPFSGKYRYTKNNGAWITLEIESATTIDDITSLELYEFYDGKLTGTWDVRYNMSENTLNGTMTNNKNDTYDVSLHKAFR